MAEVSVATQGAEIPLQVSSQGTGMNAASKARVPDVAIYHRGYHLLHGEGTLMSGGSFQSYEPSPYSFLDSMAGNNVYLILFH